MVETPEVPTKAPVEAPPATDAPTKAPTVVTTVAVTSDLTFTDLDVPEEESDRDAFVSTMEDGVREVITDNLGSDDGTTVVEMVAINGDALAPDARAVLRRLTTKSVITFDIQQTVRTSDGADEEQLKLDVAEALDIEDAKEVLETENLQAEYGVFTLGKIETDIGGGADPIVETAVRNKYGLTYPVGLFSVL